MFIAIVLLFLFILLGIAVLNRILPEMKEDDEAEFNLSHESDFADSTEHFDDFNSSSTSSKPGGIESAMGSGNFADNEFKL